MLDYTFHIRDNARFNNGDPVTADDVKFSLDRFGNTKLNAIIRRPGRGLQVHRSSRPIHRYGAPQQARIGVPL